MIAQRQECAYIINCAMEENGCDIVSKELFMKQIEYSALISKLSHTCMVYCTLVRFLFAVCEYLCTTQVMMYIVPNNSKVECKNT